MPDSVSSERLMIGHAFTKSSTTNLEQSLQDLFLSGDEFHDGRESNDDSEAEQIVKTAEVNPAAEARKLKEKAKKRRHEKERKARKKALKLAAENAPPGSDRPKPRLHGKIPDLVEQGRQQGREDFEEPDQQSSMTQIAVFPTHIIPGFLNFISVAYKEGTNATNILELIATAVKDGLDGETDLVRTADMNYIGNASTFARINSPITRISENVNANEVVVFRRTFPIGSTFPVNAMRAIQAANNIIHIEITGPLLVTTDGSPEEAVYALIADPLSPKPLAYAHSLPLFRKCMFDINHGSKVSERLHTGRTYAQADYPEMSTTMQLARWVKAKVENMSEEIRESTMSFCTDSRDPLISSLRDGNPWDDEEVSAQWLRESANLQANVVAREINRSKRIDRANRAKEAAWDFFMTSLWG